MSKKQRVRKAVIPVAGFGTRFLPATKAIPKELLPIIDKPVIQYIVEEAVASGIEEIIFVTSEHKNAIEDHFERNSGLETFLKQRQKDTELSTIQSLHQMAQFVYVHQDEPLGLGHAVLQAKDAVAGEPFIVFGGDDIIESTIPAAKQLIEVYEKYGGSVLGVVEVPKEAVNRYGVIDPLKQLEEGVTQIKDIVEKPKPHEAPSQLAAVARWLLTPEIFEELEQTKPGAGGEIQLPDGIRTLLKKQSVFAKVYNGTYRDCGNKVEYLKAIIAFSLQHPEMGEQLREYSKKYLDPIV
ncbi:MAG TPA: UTP--glucose-1-phosphate uridylyltransferase GalU [Patescibacteria group bacterium]|nr:UTP--glucose-1-phosphate uridylyltransferase GalU [Patescibacteria group bacterium]